MFSLLFLALLSLALAQRHEENRNVLHFSNAAGWQGPPAALFTNNNVLRLYYEQPLDTDKVTGSAQMKWAQASSRDGITWKDEDAFVKYKAGGGTSAEDVSYYQGGMIKNQYPDLGSDYLAVFHHTGGRSDSIRSRFTTDGITSIISPKGGLLIEGKVAVDAFQFNAQTYLALISKNGCNIEFNRIKGTTSQKEGKKERFIDVENSGSFSTGLIGKCRGVQVHPLGSDWLIALSHGDTANLFPTQTKYWYGKFNPNGNELTFVAAAFNGKSGPYVLDYGHDAQDFKFAEFNGKVVTIGWNGNEIYEDKYPTKAWKNAVTIPRIISKIENGRLIQAPIDFSSRAIKNKVKFNGEKDKALGTKACYSSADFGAIEPKKAGAFIFDLEFKHKDQFKGAGFLIEFKSTGKTPEVLAVHFNKNNGATTDMFQLAVDRSGTDSSFSKQTTAIGEIETVLPLETHKITIILDKSTIEVFGVNGRISITESYFLKGKEPLSKICISSLIDNNNVILTKNSVYGKYSSIWNPHVKPSASTALSTSFVAMLIGSLFFFY